MNIRKDIAISDNGFIFDPVTGESYTLNPIAVEILSLYKDGNSKNVIIEVLLKKYDVPEIELEKSISDFENMINDYNLTEK
jgi:hypothetical protein